MSQFHHLPEKLLGTHAEREFNAAVGSEKVGHAWEICTCYVVEKQGWTATGNDASVDLSQLQIGIDRSLDLDQLAFAAQYGQVFV